MAFAEWRRRPESPARWNPLPRLGRTLARRRTVMRTAPAIFALERFTRRITDGRKGILDVAGLPALQLTVAGRRTGIPRTVTLLYVPDVADEKRFLIVSSNWGKPQQPSWSANLLGADHAELRVRQDSFPVRVRQLTGADRDRAWRRALEFWPGYAMEQKLAGERRFRLFELTRE
ncbi:nitroreductase family deazaflavin-dependent oxidoreductase [Nocardia yunnanensis]|uniref:Nitroreductase family deazaflavin-dependent oxidoreductase n=1 Tax=Nocardia yunnanensis TaxID=2382165 RepID=A0A386ZLZ3_9NOCA|nr:nitroreductase family deazaflavin-dependent oxidoreductase [Nocardia yunnanensis]AYF78587.1 nitroreductase family deazaflavin-dependent oxidoreductase [Nocardia yunnanensis]